MVVATFIKPLGRADTGVVTICRKTALFVRFPPAKVKGLSALIFTNFNFLSVCGSRVNFLGAGNFQSVSLLKALLCHWRVRIPSLVRPPHFLVLADSGQSTY